MCIVRCELTCYEQSCDIGHVTFVSALVIGKPLAVKPSKIVAGHDPDKTNEWLQALADAINKKVQLCISVSAAQAYLALTLCYK